MSPNQKRATGRVSYTFPLMLIIVAAMAFAAWRLDLAESYRRKRDNEAELLSRGRAYQRAIEAFYSENKRYPRAGPPLPDLSGRQFWSASA